MRRRNIQQSQPQQHQQHVGKIAVTVHLSFFLSWRVSGFVFLPFPQQYSNNVCLITSHLFQSMRDFFCYYCGVFFIIRLWCDVVFVIINTCLTISHLPLRLIVKVAGKSMIRWFCLSIMFALYLGHIDGTRSAVALNICSDFLCLWELTSLGGVIHFRPEDIV